MDYRDSQINAALSNATTAEPIPHGVPRSWCWLCGRQLPVGAAVRTICAPCKAKEAKHG